MHWLCIRCRETYPGTPCPVHPDEDLLDIRNEDVIQFLSETDHRRRMKRMTVWTLASGMAGTILLIVGMVSGFVPFTARDPAVFVVGAMLGGSGIGAFFARKTFVPHFLTWTHRLDAEDPAL